MLLDLNGGRGLNDIILVTELKQHTAFLLNHLPILG